MARARASFEVTDEPVPGPSRRRVLAAFATLGGGALLCAALVVFTPWLMVRLSWPHVEPLGNPEIGFSYTCNYMEYLLLEDPTAGPGTPVPDDRPGRETWCAEQLGALLAATGATHVRIGVEWSQVEPRPGEYDFALLDALLAECGRHGAKVLLTVGIKSQRHPEYYIPQWAIDEAGFDELVALTVVSDDPVLRKRALDMVKAVAAHAAQSPVVEAWGADNEPFVFSSRGEFWNHWIVGRDFVAEEVAAIHATDALRRPVAVNHGQHFVYDRNWKWALEAGDVLATSIYPFRNDTFFGHDVVMPILEIGPLGPNYAHQARLARSKGKDFWITEMQAEPWADRDVHTISPDSPSPNLTHGKFARSIAYARRTGASRVYLWGAEWWLYQRDRYGDSSWLEQARAAIAGESTSLARK